MKGPTTTMLGVLAILCVAGAARKLDIGDAGAAIRKQAAPVRRLSPAPREQQSMRLPISLQDMSPYRL